MLPTVTTQEFESECEVNEKGRRVISDGKDSRSLNIARLASLNMLPTPIAGDWKGQLRSDGTASMLSGKASLGLLPTPMAQSRETDIEKTLERKEKYGGMKRAMYLENYAVMGMLPTPLVTDIEGGIVSKEQIKNKNGRWVRISNNTGTEFGAKLRDVAPLLPTPAARNHKGKTKSGKRVTKTGKIQNYGDSLPNIVDKLLPTPQASEGTKIGGTENQDSLTKRARQFSNNSSKLNPQFVAEMMGFPNKWTEKPFEEDAENSFDAVDFNDFPTSYPIVQEEFQPNGMTHSKWRRESIKAYGNAVVPQVVLEIFKAIESYDKLTKS